MNFHLLPSKLELKLMLILLNKLKSIIKSQLMLIIKHGKNILRTVNSFLTMLNITKRNMSAKESVLKTKKH